MNRDGGTVMVEQLRGETLMVEQLWWNSNGAAVVVEQKWWNGIKMVEC